MHPPNLDITTTVFDNGLRLITLEKHDVPIVTSSIWYRIGSAHEAPGHTGLAHLLEHLLFKGTPTYPKGSLDALTAMYGGHNNAGTSFDYTMYYFNFSSDRWEIALALEADRMQHCLFDPAEFEAERNVVLEELKRQQDSPWGELGVQMEATMFPGHPYHHPVLGWQADLEQLSRETVIEYYRTYYVPNNATLVIVGDIETSAVIEQVRRHFEQIPANPTLPAMDSPPLPSQTEHRIQLVQENTLKRLQIGYHATTLADPDTYALDLIDALLSQGKTTRLYHRLVEQEQLVTFVDTWNNPRRLPGVFSLFSTLHPGKEPARVEQIVEDELRRLRTEPVSTEELQKAKNVIAADFLFEKETTSGLAHSLGEYALLHTHEYIQTYIDQIEGITPADIMRVAQTYLVEENRTVGWSLPATPSQEHQAADAVSASLPPPSTDMAFHTSPIEKDDSSSPVTSSPFVFAPKDHQFHHHRWVLDNGLTVLCLENHVLPVVSLEVFVEAGQRYERDEHAGVAVLTGQLLDEGSTHRSGFEIAQAIESVGGILETQSQGASAQVLSQDVRLAIELLAEVLIHPVFPEEKLEQKRQQLLASLEADEDNLPLVGYNLFRDMVYGSHPYHRPRKGYKATLQALSRSDVREYFESYFHPNNTIVAIVGDADPDAVFAYVQQYFGEWQRQPLPPQPDVTIPSPVGPTHTHLPRNKAQTHLYLGHLGITRTNPDFYPLLTMDHILGLGAGFTDRISKTLRDEQGLAYSVSANISLSAEREPGVFMAYIGTSPGNMYRAIDGFLDEIRRIRTDLVSPEELEVAHNYITGNYVFHFETSTQLAHYLVSVERYQLGEDYIWTFPELIQSVTREDILRVARQYLDPDNYYIASTGRPLDA
ncbi:hypothetical protein GF339_06025 [candidate division KSB3 bacterium]|uniref:Peptidase M16 n=1 Tax=candidate division KSB3 bacterium TaxID=2044937 RepID=A0A9D5Q5R0_9BACT|nr:hypothetical protein [candidate division KSB3 bacterium]